MPLHRRRLLAGLLVGALLIAGCATQPPPTPPASGAPATPAATAGSTAPATPTAPTASSVPTTSPLAADAAALEALLPATADGVAFTRSTGDALSFPGSMTAQLGPILARYDRTVADVRVASEVPSDASGGEAVMVVAVEVTGVPATDWMGDAILGAATLVPKTIGGKAVWTTGAGTFPTIAYPVGDVLFEILLASDTMAAAIVAELP